MATKRASKAKPNLGGRPPLAEEYRLSSPVLVRLNPETREALAKQAKLEGESLAGMARIILERSLARRKAT